MESVVRRVNETVHLILKGVISEKANFPSAGQTLGGASRVVIDTKDVERINSVGVQHWIAFIRSIDVPAITLKQCSPAIVAQLNSVMNFNGSAVVESVMAPFFCAACDMERFFLIDISAKVENPAELIQGVRRCDKCGGEVEFDDLPDRYFAFLQTLKR